MALQRILFGTDGSSGSLAAARWLAPVAGALGAEVVAVHAYNRLDDLVDQRERKDFPQLLAEAQERLDGPWVQPLRDVDVAVRTLLIEEAPAFEVLARTAYAESAGLVVVGTCGRTGWRALVVGSTATRLVGLGAVAVTVVPEPPPDS